MMSLFVNLLLEYYHKLGGGNIMVVKSELCTSKTKSYCNTYINFKQITKKQKMKRTRCFIVPRWEICIIESFTYLNIVRLIEAVQS